MECCNLLPVQELDAWQVEQWTAHLLRRFHQGRCLLPSHMGLGEWRYLQLCRQYGEEPVRDETILARQALLAELRIEYTDGTTETIGTGTPSSSSMRSTYC